MQSQRHTSGAMFGALFAIVVVASFSFAALTKEKTPPAPEKPNPVQHEMRLLQEAMRDAVTAIAAGDVRKLPKRLHQVHTAAGDTKTALKTGAYKPPRGGDKVDAFIALDEDFHREMILMVKAARKNDVDKTAQHFGALMSRCNACHAQYREPPELK